MHDEKGMIEGGWWACEYPERPPEQLLTRYDSECRACMIHARAVLMNAGDQSVIRLINEEWEIGILSGVFDE